MSRLGFRALRFEAPLEAHGRQRLEHAIPRSDVRILENVWQHELQNQYARLKHACGQKAVSCMRSCVHVRVLWADGIALSPRVRVLK